MKDREFLYIVAKRVKKNGEEQWERVEIKATSMVEVSRELRIPLDDLRYIYKVVVK